MFRTTSFDEEGPRSADSGGGAKSESGDTQFSQREGSAAMSRLLRTIEGEVIPRLLLALRAAPNEDATHCAAHSETDIEDVSVFARLITTHDLAVASAYVRRLLARDVPLETIYLQLLAPAARLLGEWWKQDVCDFTEVTSGLCRMHQLLHEFSPMFLNEVTTGASDRHLLLSPMPGEQHSFGLIMLAEFFRRAGWDVWDLHPSSDEEVLTVVRKQWFAVVGVSVGLDSRIDELGSLIGRIRATSRNAAVAVMVGGPAFVAQPNLVARVGADGSAKDGRHATVEAARLVGLLARHR